MTKGKLYTGEVNFMCLISEEKTYFEYIKMRSKGLFDLDLFS